MKYTFKCYSEEYFRCLIVFNCESLPCDVSDLHRGRDSLIYKFVQLFIRSQSARDIEEEECCVLVILPPLCCFSI